MALRVSVSSALRVCVADEFQAIELGLQLRFGRLTFARGRRFSGAHPLGLRPRGVELGGQRLLDLCADARELGGKCFLCFLRLDSDPFCLGAGNLGFGADTLGFFSAQPRFFGAQALRLVGAEAGFLGAQPFCFFGLEPYLIQSIGDRHLSFRTHARQLGVEFFARGPLGSLARFGDSGLAHRFSGARFRNRGLAHGFGLGLHACQVRGHSLASLPLCGRARLGDRGLANGFGVDTRFGRVDRDAVPRLVACAIEGRAEIEDVFLVGRRPRRFGVLGRWFDVLEIDAELLREAIDVFNLNRGGPHAHRWLHLVDICGDLRRWFERGGLLYIRCTGTGSSNACRGSGAIGATSIGSASIGSAAAYRD